MKSWKASLEGAKASGVDIFLGGSNSLFERKAITPATNLLIIQAVATKMQNPAFIMPGMKCHETYQKERFDFVA